MENASETKKQLRQLCKKTSTRGSYGLPQRATQATLILSPTHSPLGFDGCGKLRVCEGMSFEVRGFASLSRDHALIRLKVSVSRTEIDASLHSAKYLPSWPWTVHPQTCRVGAHVSVYRENYGLRGLKKGLGP